MFSNDGCNYNKANRVNFDNDVFYVKFFDTDGKSLCLLRGEIFKWAKALIYRLQTDSRSGDKKSTDQTNRQRNN